MSRKPRATDVVGQTLERALDPLTSALKRATVKRVQPVKVDKAVMPVSPLAVAFPRMPPIAGLVMATGRAGFYKHEREDRKSVV